MVQVPSSVNRVYSLIHPDLISLPFTYASGVVLPLMGFWNSVIYITTSWRAVSMLFTGFWTGEGVKRPHMTTLRPSMSDRKQMRGDGDSLEDLASEQETQVRQSGYAHV